MKNTIAALIATVFATAAFAQTPAAPAPAKAEATRTKEVAKAEAKETKAVVKADAKEAAVAADAKVRIRRIGDLQICRELVGGQGERAAR